jgi:hypothetical protein
MSCNCLEEIKTKVMTELPLKNKKYEGRKITDFVFEHESIMFLDQGKTDIQLSTPAIIKYNQKNKKGEMVNKKETVNFSFHYCPFCGKEYDK